jgi:hypothetical protein
MRAYLAINYHPDHANRPLIEAITDALAQNGYETICIARAMWSNADDSVERLNGKRVSQALSERRRVDVALMCQWMDGSKESFIQLKLRNKQRRLCKRLPPSPA